MVQDILKRCVVDGNVVKLPEGQLDRKEYLDVKNKLELIGGKWKGNKIQGFVFEDDPTELLEDLQNGDDRNLKKEFQFFPTPKDIAVEMVLLLRDIYNPEMRVLEPSAGDGALIKAFRSVYPASQVECFELMELNQKKLQSVEGAILRGDDFLKCDYKELFDIIIANPPFTKNQDIDHIRKMFEVLKPGGTVVTLCSQSWYTGSQKKQIDFKEWLESMGVFPFTLPAKRFQESGTNITPLRLMIQKSVVERELDVDKAFGPTVIPEDVGENIQPPLPERACRICGCTDNNCLQCIVKTGQPCYWVDDDLCSACANETHVEGNKEQVFSEEQIESISAGFSNAYKEMKQEETLEDICFPQPMPDYPMSEPQQILQQIKETNKEIDQATLELEQMLSSDQTKDMNFFKQLFDLVDGIDVTLRIKRMDGKLKLEVLPQAGASLRSAVIAGTPEDLDAGFFEAITVPVQKAKGLKLEFDDFHKSVVAAKEELAKKPEEVKQATKPEVTAKAPVKKAEKVEKKKEVKHKVAEPSLFD